MSKTNFDIDETCKRCPCLARCVRKAFMPCKNGVPVIKSIYSLKQAGVVD